jgi:hypothetical protein
VFHMAPEGEIPATTAILEGVPDLDPTSTYSVIETFDLGEQETLVPWVEIPAVQNASGVGIYTTTFALPESVHHEPEPCLAGGGSHRASLETSALLFSFGATRSLIRGWINGKLLPPLDTTPPSFSSQSTLSTSSPARTHPARGLEQHSQRCHGPY